MDEDLKAILDEARGQGASEAQLQNIIDLYKKKSQDENQSSLNGGTSSPASSENFTPEILKAPSSSGPANISSILDQGAKDFKALQEGNVPLKYQPADNTAKDNTTKDIPDAPSYSVKSITGRFDSAFHVIPDMAAGAFTLIHEMQKIGAINQEDAEKPNMGMQLFNWASDYLKKLGNDAPLPDTFTGKSIGAIADVAPIVMTMGGGESASIEKSITDVTTPYLSKMQIFQGAITKAGGPLTQYLATSGALTGINEGYKGSGGKFLPTLEGGISGFNEGTESGATLELQMAAGGKIGSTLFKKMVSSGIADESGILTEQALKSFIGSPTAFAAGSVVSDLANNKPVDWQNAGVSAITALPFEAPHVFEAYNVSKGINKNNTEQRKVIDGKINEAIAIRDNNAIINFSNADPGDLLKAMQSPETSQELQIQALEKGISAQKTDDIKDKNTLHLQQLDLQNQSDIKRLGETVINHGVDGFIEAVNHTELPDNVKDNLLKKANAINQVFNPTEVKKAETGKIVSELNNKIQELHQSTFSGGLPGIKSDNLVQLNDLIGQRVKAQTDLFNLSYGDDQQQKSGVQIADHIANNPVTNPAEIAPEKAIVPITTPFISDAHLIDVKNNGDVTIRQKDGTDETLTKKEAKTLGITEEHINKFIDGNKPDKKADDKLTKATKIPVPESNPIDLERHEGGSDFEHKVRTSTNPEELASMYDDKIHDLQQNLGIDGAIADYNGRISPQNFYEHDDRNNVTPAIARNYFVRKGDKAIGIDNQAQEINNIYFNGTDTVQPGDITDFMVRHPSGHGSYFTPAGNEHLALINDRYRDITGKNLRKDIAKKLAEKYNVSNKVAVEQANIINGLHNTELIEKRVNDLVNSDGPFQGFPDMDKAQSELERYISDPSSEWNLWHDVFDGKKPNEHDLELTKQIIDEQRKNQEPSEGTVEEPTTGSEDSPAQSASPGEGEPGVTTSDREPKRVAEEYDRKIAEHELDGGGNSDMDPEYEADQRAIFNQPYTESQYENPDRHSGHEYFGEVYAEHPEGQNTVYGIDTNSDENKDQDIHYLQQRGYGPNKYDWYEVKKNGNKWSVKDGVLGKRSSSYLGNDKVAAWDKLFDKYNPNRFDEYQDVTNKNDDIGSHGSTQRDDLQGVQAGLGDGQPAVNSAKASHLEEGRRSESGALKRDARLDGSGQGKELANEKIDPDTAKAVKTAMTNLFPNINTHYYATIDDFNKAAEATNLKQVIDNGNVIHAYVDKNRVIHFNPEYMTKDTQIHEQGHVLTNWAYHYAPELYKRMIDAGRRLGDVHKELRENGYENVKGNPLYEEAFVTALAREGAGRLDEIVKGPSQRSELGRFIHEAWVKFERYIAGKTGYSLSSFKNIQDMTFGEFSKYVNDKFLLSDVKVSDVSSKELSAKNKRDSENARLSSAPARKPGESLADYAKRVADWNDNKDEELNQPPATPPDKIAGGTNATQAFGNDWSLPEETKTEKAQRKGQDYMNRAKVAQERIKEAGGTIDKDSDYYNHQRRVAAIAEHQIEITHEQIYESKNKKKPALFQRMKEFGINQTDLGLFLYAKHAEERNRENARTRQEAYNAERERVVKRLQEARDENKKGNITYFKNKLDVLDKNENKKYPLMDDGGSGMTNAQSKEILKKFDDEGKTEKLQKLADQYKETVTDKQLKYDLDSGRISQDDFDSLKEKYKNYVPLQVKEYVDAKNTGNTLSKLIKVKSAFQRAQGSIAQDFNKRVNPLGYGIVQLERAIVEGEKNKLLNTFYNLVEQNPNEAVWDIIHPKYKVTYKADGSVDKLDNITDQNIKDNSLYGFKEGAPFYLHIKDDVLKRAVKKEGVAKTWQVLNNVSGFLRNGLTVYNPAFWVPNFVKDNFSASFNLSTKNVDGLVGKFEKGIPSAMNGVIQYWKGNRDHPDAKIFQSYLENGATLSYSRYEQDVDKLQHITNYFETTDKSKLNPTVWVPKLGEYMNHCSELFELTTRVAAYKAAIDSGIPEHEAAIISKEATIDFSQKGEWSPIFNSLYLFSNAGVQGASTFFRNLSKSPKSAGKVIAGAIVSGILSAAFNQQTNGVPNPNGTDDENDYYRLSDNDKQGNIIIRNVFGNGFFKIPIGHELGVFPYMGDKIYNYITGKAGGGETTVDISKYIFSAYSPVGGGSLAQTLSPTILDPFVQLGENQNAFGTDIYKKTDANAIEPQSQSHFSTTDPIYVALSDKLHKFTGGTGAKSGLIEIPPDVIPWAIQTAVGGAGKTLTQTVDALGNTLRLEPTEVKKIPVLYRFYTTGNDKNYRANVIGLLDNSGTKVISGTDQTKFYQDAMKAVLKGEITDKQYDNYISTFQKNQLRISISEKYPNATPDELKEMMK